VRDAAAYRVDATADLAASPSLVWQTLTDYENLPRFIPGIRRVTLVSVAQEGGRQRLRVEQTGELSLFFFTQRVAVLLDVVQQPRTRIDTVAVPHAGDAGVRSFEGSYTLQSAGSGARLTYHARIVPDFLLPPLVDAWLLRRTLQPQFDAMLAEIERRRSRADAEPRGSAAAAGPHP
jgi:carbon monoxide dehydrogenase subunit G